MFYLLLWWCQSRCVSLWINRNLSSTPSTDSNGKGERWNNEWERASSQCRDKLSNGMEPRNANIGGFPCVLKQSADLRSLFALVCEMLYKPLNRNNVASLTLIDLPESSFIKLRQNQIISRWCISIWSALRKCKKKGNEKKTNFGAKHNNSDNWWALCALISHHEVHLTQLDFQPKWKTVAFISNEAQFIPYTVFPQSTWTRKIGIIYLIALIMDAIVSQSKCCCECCADASADQNLKFIASPILWFVGSYQSIFRGLFKA